MKIMFLAPQPLYQDRGTPIANKRVLNVLSQRGDEVDVVTYHEGTAVEIKNVSIHRIPNLKFIRDIRPGFSWKKLVCDFFMGIEAFKLVLKNRYDLIHAVEESVFIAMVLSIFFRIPYVYDMDSSLAQQLVEKYPFLKFIAPLFEKLEGLAIKHSASVIVVCDALGEIAQKYEPRKMVTLHDVPVLPEEQEAIEREDLREKLGIRDQLLMYVGNLESYQGIDLMLESFAQARQQTNSGHLVIIGGVQEHIAHYTAMARKLQIGDFVHFMGSRPVAHLSMYLEQADILVSPRIKGNNTPMKIYSYLYSGRACLATNLGTHTQVLSNNVSRLADASPEDFAKGMIELMNDDNLREQLGHAGIRLINEKYDYNVFLKNLNSLMEWLEVQTVPMMQVAK